MTVACEAALSPEDLVTLRNHAAAFSRLACPQVGNPLRSIMVRTVVWKNGFSKPRSTPGRLAQLV